MFLFTLLLSPQFRKLLIYAPLEEQPKQSMTREEMTEVRDQWYQSNDSVQLQTRNVVSFCVPTAGENHLRPLLRPGFHQSVHWISFSRGPQGKRQVQPTQVLFVQGEICRSRCAEAENASNRKKKINLFLALIGIVPKFQRRLCSCAPTTYGAPGGWHAREQAALCVRDHLWADSRVQALELLKGMCEPNKQSFLSHEKYPEILCFAFKLFLTVT